MISFKSALIAVLVSAGLSAAVTRYYWPSVQTKTVATERIVEHNNIHTVVRTVKAPDGTETTTSSTVDNSVRTEASKSTAIAYKASEWLVGASVGLDTTNGGSVYGASVSKRIIGPIWLGVMADTKAQLGLEIQIEF